MQRLSVVKVYLVLPKGHEICCERNQWPLFWLQRSASFGSIAATYLLHLHDWQSGDACIGL
jgi:hypothetical protein